MRAIAAMARHARRSQRDIDRAWRHAPRGMRWAGDLSLKIVRSLIIATDPDPDPMIAAKVAIKWRSGKCRITALAVDGRQITGTVLAAYLAAR